MHRESFWIKHTFWLKSCPYVSQSNQKIPKHWHLCFKVNQSSLQVSRIKCFLYIIYALQSVESVKIAPRSKEHYKDPVEFQGYGSHCTVTVLKVALERTNFSRDFHQYYTCDNVVMNMYSETADDETKKTLFDHSFFCVLTLSLCTRGGTLPPSIGTLCHDTKGTVRGERESRAEYRRPEWRGVQSRGRTTGESKGDQSGGKRQEQRPEWRGESRDQSGEERAESRLERREQRADWRGESREQTRAESRR